MGDGRIVIAVELGATNREPAGGSVGAGRAIGALGRCALHTVVLLVAGRLHNPDDQLDRRLSFADDTTTAVYRETKLDGAPHGEPVVLVVCFRLRFIRREWAHAVFRAESVLNTVLFAGFRGFVSKLWLRHDANGVYRGFYEWDGASAAEAYVRSLRFVLALVSDPASIHHRVLPGLDRDRCFHDPAAAMATAAPEESDEWWRLREAGPVPM